MLDKNQLANQGFPQLNGGSEAPLLNDRLDQYVANSPSIHVNNCIQFDRKSRLPSAKYPIIIGWNYVQKFLSSVYGVSSRLPWRWGTVFSLHIELTSDHDEKKQR